MLKINQMNRVVAYNIRDQGESINIGPCGLKLPFVPRPASTWRTEKACGLFERQRVYARAGRKTGR
jgi:hypothetical protein